MNIVRKGEFFLFSHWLTALGTKTREVKVKVNWLRRCRCLGNSLLLVQGLFLLVAFKDKVALLLHLAVNVQKTFVVNMQLKLVANLGDLEVVLANIEVYHEHLLDGLLLVDQTLVLVEALLAVDYRMLNLEQVLDAVEF